VWPGTFGVSGSGSICLLNSQLHFPFAASFSTQDNRKNLKETKEEQKNHSYAALACTLSIQRQKVSSLHRFIVLPFEMVFFLRTNSLGCHKALHSLTRGEIAK